VSAPSLSLMHHCLWDCRHKWAADAAEAAVWPMGSSASPPSAVLTATDNGSCSSTTPTHACCALAACSPARPPGLLQLCVSERQQGMAVSSDHCPGASHGQQGAQRAGES
jgi:hypothetical protein